MIRFGKQAGEMGPNVGRAIPRVDARKKVTGAAPYAAEHHVEGMLYGVIVNATIARGRVASIDASQALTVPGAVHVFTHENRPKLPFFDKSYTDQDAPAGSPFRPLYSDEIQFHGQPIALVVADTFEAARHAARLVAVTYADASAPETDLRQHLARAKPPKKWTGGRSQPPKPKGDADQALAEAAVQIDATYDASINMHNPMETHASTVVVEADGSLTVYDKTQGTLNSQEYLCKVLGLPKEQVRVLAPFVGGAFGSGLRPNHQLFFAAMAARELRRSVCVELARQQMFTFGHRPATRQRVALGATREGKLTALIHECVAETSRWEDYVEVVVNWGPLLYGPAAHRCDHKLVHLDLYTPLDMRAPGAATGAFAIECAMDELAHAAGVDPLELRLRNYTDKDPLEDRPFGSKELRACYEQGAARFGWSRRSPAPRSMRQGDQLVGWGMATGIWEAQMMYASAQATLSLDGTLVVASATADIGTGTYTVMTQIAADTLGLPLDAVTFRLGDTSLPKAPLQGGSWTAVTVGSAVKVTCDTIAAKLLELARNIEGAPLGQGVKRDDVAFEHGTIVLRSDPSRRVTYAEAMRAGGVTSIEAHETAVPNPLRMRYSHYTHSACFCEVHVDERLGVVKVTRMVSAVAAGRILSPHMARSQVLGACVGGISAALHEEAKIDHRLGAIVNHTLSEYHVPVNRDVPEIEVVFVDETDEHVNALGAKGVGEIGIVGVSAAVANAVFHATGKRVRSLPITLDKLL